MLQNILEKDEIIEKYDKFRKKYKLYPKQYCDEYKAIVARIEVKLQIEKENLEEKLDGTSENERSEIKKKISQINVLKKHFDC